MHITEAILTVLNYNNFSQFIPTLTHLQLDFPFKSVNSKEIYFNIIICTANECFELWQIN